MDVLLNYIIPLEFAQFMNRVSYSRISVYWFVDLDLW
jgi:hypothetical protein